MIKKMLFISALVCGLCLSGIAQCDPNEFSVSCKSHLNEDHFIILKEFPVVSKNGEYIEYSCVLVDIAEYEYYFTGYGWDHSTMVATIFDSERNKLASNLTHTDALHSIQFRPKKTGIHYIRFTFNEGEAFCGFSVLGFHRLTR